MADIRRKRDLAAVCGKGARALERTRVAVRKARGCRSLFYLSPPPSHGPPTEDSESDRAIAPQSAETRFGMRAWRQAEGPVTNECCDRGVRRGLGQHSLRRRCKSPTCPFTGSFSDLRTSSVPARRIAGKDNGVLRDCSFLLTAGFP